MVLPMLYAISLLYTLNTRNELQRERMSSNDVSVHDRSRVTRPGSQNPLSFNPKRSFGGTDLNTPGREMPYRSASSVERGMSGRGRSRGGSAGRRLDVHVETTVTRSQGIDGDVEVSPSYFLREALIMLTSSRHLRWTISFLTRLNRCQ